MKLSELYEGLSQTLFHFTDFESARKIISSNELRSNLGRISTSRSIFGTYPRDHKMIGVFFVLDGRAIAQSYKGRPFGGEEYNLDGDGENDWIPTGKSSQFEDAIMTKGIKNFNKYVTHVVVYVDKKIIGDGWRDEFDRPYDTDLDTHLPNFVKVVSQLRVPITVVTSVRDLPKWNRMRSVQANQIIKQLGL